MITDWLMVVITFVYVVATIFICKANYASAKASKAQLEEMKNQYKDSIRPLIEVELIYERKTFYGLRFVNHGRSNAYKVNIDLDEDFLNSIKGTEFYRLLKLQKDKECVIASGNHYDLYFGTNEYRRIENKQKAKGIIKYFDHNENCYSDIFEIDLENYMTNFSIQEFNDDLLTELKSINSSLNQISKCISNFEVMHNENKADKDH